MIIFSRSLRNDTAGRLHISNVASKLCLLHSFLCLEHHSRCMAFRVSFSAKRPCHIPPYGQSCNGLMNGDKALIWASRQSSIAFACSGEVAEEPIAKIPNFNGKVVYPVKVFLAGLKKEHNIASVYAVLNNEYKRGKDGWENCSYIGTTANLSESLDVLSQKYGAEQVAHVRVLSFVKPQLETMNAVAYKWREMVDSANGNYMMIPTLQSELDFQGISTSFIQDDEDDDDEDDVDVLDIEEGNYDLPDLPALSSSNQHKISHSQTEEKDSETRQPKIDDEEGVVSPFDASRASGLNDSHSTPSVTSSPGGIHFSKASVDAVLDEVRPYLISDGGNVSVIKVDEMQQDVYLKLEGACGSCASSTVTMKMGIERVLLENFPNLGSVIEVSNLEEESPEQGSSELDDAVRTEVKRIMPAISAMGGSAEVMSVDDVGVVEIQFRGAKRLQKGLELALLDIPKIKHIKFLA